MSFVAHNFLEDLALVLCVAACATVIFHLLKQPIVVGYLIAGMIVGPHFAVPLNAGTQRIQAISDLGVVLLIFSIGLEFDLRRLMRLLPTCGLVTAVQVAVMLVLGFLAARLMGWTPIECLFAGAIVSISSTTIVAKVFAEGVVESRLRELCFGVLLIEDLVAIVLLALLTVAAKDQSFSWLLLARVSGLVVGFLAVLLGVGLITVPYAVRGLVRIHRSEILLIGSVGICFAFALAAEQAGYSVALGAFIAGSLVAQSGEGVAIEHVIAPVRDLFGAIFFVSVGMLIDPHLLVRFWPDLLVMTSVVIVGKIGGVTLGSLAIGERPQIALRAGFAMAQIGEFAFIMAEVGIKAGATREFLYSLAVAVSALTAFLTPFLMQLSEPTAHLAGRSMPRCLRDALHGYRIWLNGWQPGQSHAGKREPPVQEHKPAHEHKHRHADQH